MLPPAPLLLWVWVEMGPSGGGGMATRGLRALRDPSLLRSGCLVAGRWVEAATVLLPVVNPASGAVLGELPRLGGDAACEAVEAAARAQGPWAARTAKQRAAVLRRWHDLAAEAADDLALLATLECGKPLPEAQAEVASGLASIEWFAEEGRRVTGDVLAPTLRRPQAGIVLKQPVGVVASITPWNFPVSMVTRKVAPALAAGCTVVLKPSEETPLTALALAELAIRAGLPGGALSVLCGDAPEIGEAVLADPRVRKISFTGSTRVGKLLMAGAAETVKRVSLELGGNAPVLVFEDADLEQAAKGVVSSAFRNSGQTCICANRILVHEDVYDAFAARVVELVSMIKVGDGTQKGITQGPMITAAGVDKAERHVADALKHGATLAAGGARTLHESGGHFFQPTVLTGVTPDMMCYREETFGPVCNLVPFSTEAEALRLANATEYGLAAYAYTTNLGRAWRVAEGLEYGMVGVNEVGVTSEVAPFGGWKQSGLGVEHSKYGIEEYLEKKYVCLGLA